MDNEFQQLEERIDGLLSSLDSQGRTALARKIARQLSRSHKLRIKQQRNPDGSRFAARKKKAKVRAAKPVRFIYKKAGGEERAAEMASWSRQGRLMVGYDREAGGLRSFRRDRVQRWLPARAGVKGLRSKVGKLRRDFMFKSMGRHLRARAGGDGIRLGFMGRVARIARVHQFGEKDRVSEGGGEVRYAQRELLGLTDEDRAMIEDMILDHLAGL